MGFQRELNDNHLDALNKLTEYLARRDHSELELRTKLARRFTPEVVGSSLAEAKERGWLKDPFELSHLVAAQLFRRGKGPLYVNAYLRKKGLPPVSFEEEEMRSLCQELLEQKFPRWTKMSFKEKQRPIRFLIQRGFPPNLAFNVVSSSGGEDE